MKEVEPNVEPFVSYGKLAKPTYRLGDFEVEPVLGVVIKPSSETRLTPKTVDVLAYLLDHAPRVVSADELLEAIWAGRVVDASAIHRRVSQIRGAFGDVAAKPVCIDTVPKRGYRVIAEVKRGSPALASNPGNRETTEPAGTALRSSQAQESSARRTAGEYRKPTIAVLPFVNLHEDSETDFFSEGISEDVLNGLSRIPGLTVIARTSSFRFKGGNHDAREIGRALGVSHIVEGSARMIGQRIRINTQLIETDGGTQLWSEQFDRELRYQEGFDAVC